MSNSGNGTPRRLEVVSFEIGGANSSNGAVVIPTWSTTYSVVAGWDAIQFDFVSGTRLSNGAVQTFSYDLDQYINDVHIQTENLSGTIENFYIQNVSAGCLLPVELESFEAIKSTNEILFQWQTLSETNTDGFELQVLRQSDFVTVDFVPAIGVDKHGRHLLDLLSE